MTEETPETPAPRRENKIDALISVAKEITQHQPMTYTEFPYTQFACACGRWDMALQGGSFEKHVRQEVRLAVRRLNEAVEDGE